jgi:membrane fusion protein, multidrug efflux system
MAAENPRKTDSARSTIAVKEDETINGVPVYRKKQIIIPILLLLAGMAAAWYWYAGTREYVSTDDAFVDANRVSISSKILGRVIALTADEGDTVHKGQVLVRLDDSDLKAQEGQARAALSLAQVSVGLAKTNLDKATDDFKRTSTQFKSKVVPREQFDHAENALSASQAEYQIAQARIQTAKAQLQIVETQLQNCTIVSPLDGVVARRWILPGDVVQPGQPTLSVYDVNNLWITANFEETKLGRIHLKDPVDIAVDTYPDIAFHGEVIQLGTHTASEFSLIPPNNASGNFTKVTQRVPIRISISRHQPDGTPKITLLPGMSVEVRVKG